MKTANKIVVINLVLAIVITVFLLIADGGVNRGSEVAFVFGLVCLGLGLIAMVIGFFLIFTNLKEERSGFLLSGAALLLLSGISCGGGTMF